MGHLPPLTAFSLTLALLAACGGDTTADTGSTSDSATPPTGDSGNTDSGTTDTSPESPCADGGWGALDVDPVDALHVRADGDDTTGTGSAASPLASISAALSATTGGGSSRIFVGPGSYITQAILSDDDGHSEVGLFGCGVDEVELSAGSDADAVLRVASATGVVLDGLALVGGTRGLVLWQGAAVTASNLEVRDASLVGVVVDGESTTAVLTDVVISDLVADKASGLAVGIAVTRADLTLEGGSVTGAAGIGVLVHQGTAVLTELTVSGTATLPDGTYGRGVHVQELGSLDVVGGVFSDNADAGVFGLGALWLGVDGVEITGTASSTIPGVSETSGDGIVVSDAGTGFPASTHTASLTDNTVSGSARLGVLLAGSALEVTDLSGNAVSGSGLSPDGVEVMAQEGVVISGGTDSWYEADVSGVAPVEVNLEPFSLSGL